MGNSDETQYGRRAFFREAFAKLVQPVAEYLDAQVDTHREIKPKPLLRPPGALPEQTFLETCERCGKCIESCPADAIRPLEHADSQLAGTPYIDPDLQPCVVCSSLACMEVCPSGALQKLTVGEIKIGLARVNHETCLRTRKIDCRFCVDCCPVGTEAIHFDVENRVEVKPSGCVGCGLCQYHCPTDPKAIAIGSILS